MSEPVESSGPKKSSGLFSKIISAIKAMFNIGGSILQASPYMIYFAGLAGSLISNKKVALYFTLGVLFFGEIMMHVEKAIFKRNFPNTKLMMRPKPPATGCGIFDKCTMGGSKTWGFPSGHSQTLCITAMFWTLYFLEVNKNKAKRGTRIAALWGVAVLVMLSRMYKGCHNIWQVSAGALIGAAYAYGFFKLLKKYVFKKDEDWDAEIWTTK